MHQKSLVFLLLFVPTLLFSRDIVHNRLSKLYVKNQAKCLTTAKRYMNYFPENPAPYYYASKIYFDKSKNAHNSRVEYSLLKKVIGYAKKFEQFNASNSSMSVEWEEYKEELKLRIVRLSDQLSKENQQTLGANLAIAFSRLDNVELELPETEAMVVDNAEEHYNASAPAVGFMGMPTGRERVSSSDGAKELELVGIINEERVKRGMQPLIWEEGLAHAARYHAYDLATQNYFNHSTYDRKDDKLVRVGGTFERIAKFYDATFVNAENIAAGNSTAKGTYQQWYSSKGHNANMFNSDSRRVGIGVYYDADAPFGYYWVFCTAR